MLYLPLQLWVIVLLLIHLWSLLARGYDTGVFSHLCAVQAHIRSDGYTCSEVLKPILVDHKQHEWSASLLDQCHHLLKMLMLNILPIHFDNHIPLPQPCSLSSMPSFHLAEKNRMSICISIYSIWSVILRRNLIWCDCDMTKLLMYVKWNSALTLWIKCSKNRGEPGQRRPYTHSGCSPAWSRILCPLCEGYTVEDAAGCWMVEFSWGNALFVECILHKTLVGKAPAVNGITRKLMPLINKHYNTEREIIAIPHTVLYLLEFSFKVKNFPEQLPY